MKRSVFMNICLGVTCVVLVVTTIVFFYGVSIKSDVVTLSSKPIFPWAIALCFLAFFCGVRSTESLCINMFCTFLVYGAADILIELGDEMLAVGAITFLIGHVFYIFTICDSRSTESEEKVMFQGTKSVRTILAVIFALFYLGVTAAAIYLVIHLGGDISIVAICVIYPLSFVIMTVLGVLYWRRASSIVLTIVGGIIYAASDICTALQALGEDNIVLVRFIMPSYWVALLLLAFSAFPLVYHAVNLADNSEDQECPLETNYSSITTTDRSEGFEAIIVDV